MKKIHIIILLVLQVQILTAASVKPKNLLRNGGFEGSDANRLRYWYCPNYWSGKLEAITNKNDVFKGKGSAKLVSAEKNGKNFCKIHYIPVDISPGAKYKVSLQVKGKGEFTIGRIDYFRKVEKNSYCKGFMAENTTQLTSKWQKVEYTFYVNEPDVFRITPTLQVMGTGSFAYIDDIEFTEQTDDEFRLEINPVYSMVADGKNASIDVKLFHKDKPVDSADIDVFQIPPERQGSVSTFKIDKSSTTVYKCPINISGLDKIIFSHKPSGCHQTAYIDVVGGKIYNEFETMLKHIEIDPLPAHFLFIGDSLTDFYRGYNYVDKLNFWLKKKYGDKIDLKNVGVGGDFITRVWQRINNKKAWRQKMYDNIFTPKPTRVFIFLGHNDTVLLGDPKNPRPQIPIEEFKDTYRKLITKIRNETNAKITILSAISSAYDITLNLCNKGVKKSGRFILFGKPELLEKYNSALKTIARKMKVDYVDLYTPTKNYPDKHALFVQDGVHINNLGNQVVALEILKYLGK